MTIDKSLLRQRFVANFENYNALAIVQEEICAQFAQMLASVPEQQIERALEVGVGTGFLSRRLLARYPRAQWTLNDLAEQSKNFLKELTTHLKVEYRWGDAEMIELPEQIDLLASASTVQWFDNLPRFMARAQKIVKKGGWLALSTFGPDNFHEIKVTAAQGLHYYSIEELRGLIESAGFRLHAQQEYTRQLLFASPIEVLRHIKATGVNSMRNIRWTKQHLVDFEQRYWEFFKRTDGQVSLTYHPILLLAQKK